MRAQFRAYLLVSLALALSSWANAADPKPGNQSRTPQAPVFVITNDDQPFPFEDQISVLQAGGTDQAPTLTLQQVVPTEGTGIRGGFFATSRVASAPDPNTKCFYVSNAGDNTISSFTTDTQSLVDKFSGGSNDSGVDNGIGMAVNANYLYAGYTTSQTIGVFATTQGCGLTYLQSVPAAGKNGGAPTGMAVNAGMLVVAYGDGSVSSFNITNGGIPVANNDLQNSSGFSGPNSLAHFATGNLPTGVDLSSNGKFAIFGDISNATVVEVAPIVNGKLGRTTPYQLGNRVDGGTIRLSPDEKLLYVVNNEGGSVTAAFFDKASGKLTPGCVSPQMRDYTSRTWYGEVAMRDNTGSGSVLYVAEFGRWSELHNPPSALGILTVAVNGNSCTLTEAPSSPLIMTWPGLLSISSFPPRGF